MFDARWLRGARRTALIGVAVVASVLGMVAPVNATPAVPGSAETATTSALSGSDFNPGFIISDQQFYSRDAMTPGEIQAFLDAKIGTCLNGQCLNVLRTNTWSRPADRTICQAYSGDTGESVATILYKVQQACGISAKVLLVTLQKEQGLITDRAPTTGELNIAMGYACPDTAPCNSEFFGIYNQLYKAAWQLKRYSTPDRWGTYQPGVRQIQYHPNASCGSLSVNIQNNATAALYNYTPYTPNSAALANLTGSAPPCGSYGNRNFWVFFTSWFGSTVAGAGQAAIGEAYATAGGAAGALGASTTGVSCGASFYSCAQYYAHGVIYWSAALGVFTVSGEFGDHYLATGAVEGPLGPPTTAYTEIVEPAHGNGFAQGFATGMIFKSAAGVFNMAGSAYSSYVDAGWIRGTPGWPTSAFVCNQVRNGCMQTLQAGAVYASTPNRAYAIVGAMDTRYKEYGGPGGSLGYPTTSQAPVESPANGNGTAQGFQSGYLYNSAAGAWAVLGALETGYETAGWVRGSLGWPTADRICAAEGECSQTFQVGSLMTSRTGTFTLDAAFTALHAAAGGLGGPLGFATTARAAIDGGANGAGAAQGFRGGYLYTSGAGSFSVTGQLEKAYEAAGWIRGNLGWPTAAAVCAADGGCAQSFQNGTLFSPAPGAGTGFAVSDAAISTAYQAAGGPSGALGYPTTAHATITGPNGSGLAQGFSGGYIYKSAAGAFPVIGPLEKAYETNGWVRGALGWPTAAGSCAGSACSQQFQGGILHADSSGVGGTVTDPTLSTAYAATGGVTGPLGAPATAHASITAPQGTGLAQGFRGGYLYAGPAGTFPVLTTMETAFENAGWLRGPLGWPTAAATCALPDGGCTQSFQGGTLYLPATGSGFAIRSATAAAYDAAGGPAGALGYPTTNQADISTPTRGAGTAQGFAGGYIYVSAAGAFAVPGALETAYEAGGWVRGPLGWPTAAPVCDPAGHCTQTFQGGTLSAG